MDPIYYQVNQTRLTENTQKGSDNLRIQQNKETKRKAQRAGDVEKSAMTSDMTSMSDDMLGDMDPDDYGGSSSQQFAQMWKEQFGEDSEKHPSQEEEADQEEEAEDPSADGLDADTEPPASESPASRPAQTELSPEARAEVAPNPATATAPVPVEAPERPPQKPSNAPLSVETEGKRPTAAAAESPTGSTNQAPRARESSREAVVIPTGPPPKQAPSRAASQASGPKSLLDFSSGFLIAEEAHWDPNAPEASSDEAQAHPASEALPEDMSFLLDKLIQGDTSHPSYRKLQQLLSRFGMKVLRTCLESETRVYLLPPGERLLAHPLLANCGESDLADAAYLPQVRLCLLEDRCLAEPPYGFHPVFYYFAHAFDHALGGENFASLKSPAVRASYEACLDGSHRFGDLMAANSPAHYFAQAVESYLAENDCFEPLWTRHDLYDFDRSIYDYIEYLLGQKRSA